MKIKLVTVGKLKEKYLKDGIAEYMKRLNRFCKVEMIELADEKTPDKASDLENQQILEKEGNKILAKRQMCIRDRNLLLLWQLKESNFRQKSLVRS